MLAKFTFNKYCGRQTCDFTKINSVRGFQRFQNCIQKVHSKSLFKNFKAH